VLTRDESVAAAVGGLVGGRTGIRDAANWLLEADWRYRLQR
jgi:hypothetical protein